MSAPVSMVDPATRLALTRSALTEAGNLCWTPPARAELVRRATPVPAGDTVLGEFLLIPSAQRPRLLVPAGQSPAAAESVRRFSQALGLRERALRWSLATALRTGLLDRVVPDRMRITARPQDLDAVRSLQDELGRLLGEPVILSLGVGTVRANRKPVLQAISPSGRPLAFIKLGDNELTRSLLAQEADALTRLAAQAPAGLTVPELLHLGEWSGSGMLVQSALATPPWLTHRPLTIPYGAMRALSDAFGLGRVALADSPAWTRIVQDAEGFPDPARSELFRTVLAEFEAGPLQGIEARHGAWHGDWTPWNMAWIGRRIRIWDWERFAEGVPAGFDALHYRFNHLMAVQRWELALDALREAAPGLLRPAGVAPSETTAITLWYLLELCRRYLYSAASPAGGPLRGRTDDLLRYLARVADPDRTIPELPDWRTT